MYRNNSVRYTITPEEPYLYNTVRLSHGDKMFTNLIDNLGISNTYDIDASTNTIPPASNSKWYFFAIFLFANLNIPFNVLTNNSNQCITKIELDSGKFILSSSPNTSYANLSNSSISPNISSRSPVIFKPKNILLTNSRDLRHKLLVILLRI